MSLKIEIDNTNTQRENLKTVANKINTKLIECGGQGATNLNNVPEQIQKMLDGYKGKKAIRNMHRYLNSIEDFSTRSYSLNTSLAFKPTLAILQIQKMGMREWQGITVYSDLNNSLETANADDKVKVYIESVNEIFVNIVVKSIAAYTGSYEVTRGIFLE